MIAAAIMDISIYPCIKRGNYISTLKNVKVVYKLSTDCELYIITIGEGPCYCTVVKTRRCVVQNHISYCSYTIAIIADGIDICVEAIVSSVDTSVSCFSQRYTLMSGDIIKVCNPLRTEEFAKDIKI